MSLYISLIVLCISNSYSLNVKQFPLHEKELTDYMTFDDPYEDEPQEDEAYQQIPSTPKTKKYLNEAQNYRYAQDQDIVPAKQLDFTNSIEKNVHKYRRLTSRSYLSEENDQLKIGNILKELEDTHKIRDSIEEIFKNDGNKIAFETNQSATEVLETVRDESFQMLESNEEITQRPLVGRPHGDQPISHLEPMPDRNVGKPADKKLQPIKGRLDTNENYKSENEMQENQVTEFTLTTTDTIRTIEMKSLMDTTPANLEDLSAQEQRIFYYFKDPVLNNVGRRFFYTIYNHRNKLRHNYDKRQRSVDKPLLPVETKHFWGESCGHNPESLCVFSRQCAKSYRNFKGDQNCSGTEPMICCELHGCQWKLLIDESSDSSHEKQSSEVIDFEIGSKTNTNNNDKGENKVMRNSIIEDTVIKNLNSKVNDKINDTRKSHGRTLKYFAPISNLISEISQKRKHKKRKGKKKLKRRNIIDFNKLSKQIFIWKIRPNNLETNGMSKLIHYLIKDALGTTPKKTFNELSVKSFIKDNPELQRYLEKLRVYNIINNNGDSLSST